MATILTNDDGAKELDWNKRDNIIKGVAHALSYLHHDCKPAIVQRDISSKNVLLDSEYEARVSDFGTTKLLNQDSSIGLRLLAYMDMLHQVMYLFVESIYDVNHMRTLT